MTVPGTFSEVLAAQLRRDPGRPLVTFYDHATDERVELSVTTYANWVAKASGLLTDVADLERGMSLRIDLPPHWLSPVFLGAAWTVGLRVTTSDEPDAVVCGPDGLQRWASRAATMPVLACSLRPLGVRFADPLPAGVLDVGVEIWSQPDGFTAWDPPTADDPATDDLSQRALLGASDRSDDLTAAVGSGLTDGGRLLSVADPASPPGMATFTEPLVRGGSLVLVRNPDPERLDDVFDAERATARA
ncbi:acyl-CoA synthetase [Nocardioides flavus (ex Wang et al. 2016)]|uniref:Acyl-CoA synthetase n=1 Tax=Nocardioides flavus (ex Wang et al. 2016) TaxID=2058780 RepID=A0ABQ3HJ02_9ACTN|nr:TIGR03089 family protein [Nocardioides flavus (ex Wang et al. 2016)]GHE16900.1 acyl-CoA synthetase [Nocardioides flavus (ex Wang et al. 2016)]